MAKRPNSKASRLSAEERVLEQQRDEIVRKQQELERRLKRLPAAIEAQEEQKRELAKRRAAAAAPAISPYVSRGGRGGTRRLRAKTRTLRTPSKERMAAKLRTLSLLIALAVIFYLLLRAVPTS